MTDATGTTVEERLQRLRRRLWVERGLFVGALGAVTCGWLSPVLFPSVWAVYVQGKPVVAMRDRSDIEAVLEQVKREQAGTTAGVEFVQRARVGRALPARVTITDARTAAERLQGAVKLRAQRAVIYVDGLPVAALPDRSAASAVLERVKSSLAPSMDALETSPAFKEKVEVRDETAEQDLWADSDAAEGLLKGEDGDDAAAHTLRRGETAWSLASAAHVSVTDLEALNPGIDMRGLHPGDKVRTAPFVRPLLTVVAEGRVTRTWTLPYPTTVQHSPTMYRGKRILKQAGRAGRERVVYRVRYENGHQTAQQVLRREVLASPHERVVVLGAMPRPSG